MSIIITGLLAYVLSILTAALSLVQNIAGAEQAAIAIKNAILSITQASGILNSLPPTIP